MKWLQAVWPWARVLTSVLAASHCSRACLTLVWRLLLRALCVVLVVVLVAVAVRHTVGGFVVCPHLDALLETDTCWACLCATSPGLSLAWQCSLLAPGTHTVALTAAWCVLAWHAWSGERPAAPLGATLESAALFPARQQSNTVSQLAVCAYVCVLWAGMLRSFLLCVCCWAPAAMLQPGAALPAAVAAVAVAILLAARLARLCPACTATTAVGVFCAGAALYRRSCCPVSFLARGSLASPRGSSAGRPAAVAVSCLS